MLLPRIWAWYQSSRRKVQAQKLPIRPSPHHVNRILNILFISALIAFLSTLPYLEPENIFTLTESRLQISNEPLFNRLAHIRSPTIEDNSLKSKLVSLDARLLYLQYGPDTIINCLFCNSDNPTSYLYYAVPSLLTPHIAHLILLGILTSPFIGGRESSVWRTSVTITAVAFAVLNVYFVGAYDYKNNTKSLRLSEMDFFHWRMRVYRGLAFAIFDVGFAAAIYLSSTNRMFLTPFSTAERLENSAKMLQSANGKLHAIGLTRNVIYRDPGLREGMDKYWTAEGRVMGEALEQKEVVDSINSALTRLDVRRIEEEATTYAERITGGVQIMQTDISNGNV